MVHICQLMCPERHTIIALAYEEEESTDEEMMQQVSNLFQEAVNRKLINPWCGLCGSKDLKPECGKTAFTNMEEAKPHLKKAEQENLATRKVFSRF